MSPKKNKFYNNYYFELATSLSKINIFKTKENPSVGCVVTDINNNFLSSGFTSLNGRPHAEYNALKKLNKKNKKKLFVTLEPCNYHGKSPPCTKEIVSKNIKEIYIGDIDPNPMINGKALNLLKKKNIDVKFKKLRSNIYENYKFSILNNLPFVTSKLAITKNFSTCVNGKKYFTNKKSLQFAHFLRYINDSILIGSKTLRKDSPKLNCRIEGLKQFSPRIFIINRNLNFKKKDLITYPVNTTIFHNSNCLNKINKYKKYFILKKILTNNNIMSPHQILKEIYNYNCRKLLIEGGFNTLNLFSKYNLINKSYVIRTNKINGNLKFTAKKYIARLYGRNLIRYKEKINLLDNELIVK